MSWAIGYDDTWKRDIGYGVPAYCDYPGCEKKINRGLAYVCCEQQPYGGGNGCGRYFCPEHTMINYGPDDEDEEPCCAHEDADHIAPEHPDWIRHKLTDITWHQWCLENPDEVKRLKEALPNDDT